MNRKPYSAGAVKFSFWFIEFRKTVQLLAEGKSFSDIKLLNEQENIYSASTKARAQMIYSTVTARIKMLDPSFYPVFLSSDIATQKMFALVAALAHDTLFFDFVYEVVREKMILGVDELTDADIRVFFKDKQAQMAVPLGYAVSYASGNCGFCGQIYIQWFAEICERNDRKTRKNCDGRAIRGTCNGVC